MTSLALTIVLVVAALVASAALIAATGGPWRGVLTALLDGSLRRRGRWGGTLTEAAPLLVVALGAIVATRAGLVNIGQEGQLAIGAACAAFVAGRNSGPVALVVSIVVGACGGAAWAGIAATLRWWRKVPEVISTLLLVFVAAQLTNYFLTRTSLLLDPQPGVPNRVQAGVPLDAATRLPQLSLIGNHFPISVILAAAAAAVLAVLLRRSVWGFRLMMAGHNPRTAHRMGVSAVAVGAGALAISGGLAGSAGALMLTGGASGHRFTAGFSNNVGWEGLLVALVARNRPLVCIPVAFAFAALRTGSGFLASTGVDRSVVDVVRGLLVIAVLAPPAITAVRGRRNAGVDVADPRSVTGAVTA